MAASGFRGPVEIYHALRYSLQGLRAAVAHEASFRLELYLFVVLAPAALFLGATGLERALMLASLLAVLALELINGAIEAIVDKTTPERHELAGRSKDMGSAAVFLAQVGVVVIWTLILWR